MPSDAETRVRLDLNHAPFQVQLLALQKQERHAALETFAKLLQMTWAQVYRDAGLKWERIASVRPPEGVDAVYSLRITRSRRATVHRVGGFMCFLSVAPDHDSTYGKK